MGALHKIRLVTGIIRDLLIIIVVLGMLFVMMSFLAMLSQVGAMMG